MRALAILPTYNEAENVVDLAHEILRSDDRLEVLVVDDNSPDGTGDLVEAASQAQPRIQLLRRPGKLGLGTAYLAGFGYALEAGHDLVLTMDSDWSHHPRHLPSILEAIEEADMVVGSRYVHGGGIINWAWYRRVLSWFANFYARSLLRLPVRDCTGGYRCYRREVLETVQPFEIRSSGYSFLEEMVWRVSQYGFRIREVPIVFEDRTRGDSKIDSSEIYRAAWHVLLNAVRPPALPARDPDAKTRPQTESTAGSSSRDT